MSHTCPNVFFGARPTDQKAMVMGRQYLTLVLLYVIQRPATAAPFPIVWILIFE